MEQTPARNAGQGTGGLGAGALKLIAITAMVFDHIAYLFLPADSALYGIFRFFGRITGPVMFYLLTVGYRRTRNVNRYMLRLAVFALISYLPYFYMINKELPSPGHFAGFDVIYTLFLGLLAIRARHEIKSPALRWTVVAGVFLLSLQADWYYLAIIFILVFDCFYGDFNKQAFAYCMIVLIRLLPAFSPHLTAFFRQTDPSVETLLPQLYQLGLFLPVILLRSYNGRRGRTGPLLKWGFYVFYPAHITALCVIYALSGTA
jgi:hypothetical protein